MTKLVATVENTFIHPLAKLKDKSYVRTYV